MCTRLEIPLPRAGHWQKIAHSKRTWVEFKENKKLDAEKIILQFRDINKPKEKIFKPSPEDYPDINFQVEKTLLNPDVLVAKSEKIIRAAIKDQLKRNPDYDTMYNCWQGLSMFISRHLVDRALCFMDAFVKMMRARGHDIVCERDTFIVIGKQRIKIALREKVTRKEIQTEFNHNSFQDTPNGKLCLKVDNSRGKEWVDGKVIIEEQLPAILYYIEEVAEEMRLNEIRWEKQRIENERLATLKQEREAREDEELSALHDLMTQAIRWERMNMLRAYIRDMEKLAVSRGPLDKKIIEWIRWAQEKADWFDPSIDRPDELLHDVDKTTLKMRRKSDYRYYHYETEKSEDKNFWKSHWWNR
jgi:hypothetical protein